MKRTLLSLILFLILSISAYSQYQQQDSIIILQKSIEDLQDRLDKLQHDADSIKEAALKTKIDTTAKEDDKATKFFKSLFGESRELSNADSLIREYDKMPSFSMYKDNYIITGTELTGKTDKDNSDAKFQVSIRQRLTNSTLPFKTHVYLTYTQRAYWDIYKESFPFRDLNFNPGIGIGKPLVVNNRLFGLVALEFEHESNGKDESASRSWNKIGLNTVLTFSDRWIFQTKWWIPFVDKEDNPNLPSYAGYGFVALTYSSLKRKYNTSCVITKRAGSFFDTNILLNFSVRMFTNENIYLFLEYYDGYGECLLNYKDYRQRLRVGFQFKTNFISFY